MKKVFYLFLALLLVTGCEEIKSDFKISTYSLKCELDGDKIKLKDNKEENNFWYTNNYGIGDSSFNIDPFCFIEQNGIGFRIEFYSKEYGIELEHSEDLVLEDLFQVKSYDYRHTTIDTVYTGGGNYYIAVPTTPKVGVNVVVIENENEWQSTNVVQSENSNFILTSVKVKKEPGYGDGDYFACVKGEFNCTVADEQGNLRTVENAEFQLAFSGL